MNQANFNRKVEGLICGDGWRRHKDVNLASWLDANGVTITGATTPVRAAVEGGFSGVQAALNIVDLGGLNFVIPEDYDSSKDHLRIRLLAEMLPAGGLGTALTDTPTVVATMIRKRAGVAVTADLVAAGGAAVVAAATTAAIQGAPNSAWYEIALDSLGCLPGDTLWIDLTSAAHATDAINFFGVEAFYRSNLAMTTHSMR